MQADISQCGLSRTSMFLLCPITIEITNDTTYTHDNRSIILFLGTFAITEMHIRIEFSHIALYIEFWEEIEILSEQEHLQ
jgi:hypothetical protein